MQGTNKRKLQHLTVTFSQIRRVYCSLSLPPTKKTSPSNYSRHIFSSFSFHFNVESELRELSCKGLLRWNLLSAVFFSSLSSVVLKIVGISRVLEHHTHTMHAVPQISTLIQRNVTACTQKHLNVPRWLSVWIPWIDMLTSKGRLKFKDSRTLTLSSTTNNDTLRGGQRAMKPSPSCWLSVS